jgi:hypothetical protein
MWLNFVINENECLINFDKSAIEEYDPEEIETLSNKIINVLREKFPAVEFIFTEVKNQNISFCEIKGNLSNIDDEDLKAEIQEQ